MSVRRPASLVRLRIRQSGGRSSATPATRPLPLTHSLTHFYSLLTTLQPSPSPSCDEEMSVECASEGVREGVAVALFATAPLLWALLRHWRSSSSSSSSSSDSGSDSGSKGSGGVREREAVSVCGSGAHVLRPGLVLLRGALDERAQTLLAERLFLHGHTRGKWWAREKQHGREQCVLNNHRQGRGRIYDALHSYPDQDELLRGVCCDSVALARRLDPAMPPLHCPTHLLTLYYTSSRKLGWHRDNGE